MSLFSLPAKIIDRVLASLERVDVLIEQSILLVAEARAELQAYKEVRERTFGRS